MPFAVRGDAWVRRRAQEIVDLLAPDCAHIVIGCNTMSVVADSLEPRAAILDLLSPTRVTLGRFQPVDTLVVVGSVITVGSLRYEGALASREVIRIPCPTLATTIETFGSNSPQTARCIAEEISGRLPPGRHGRVLAVLACTHYPLVRSRIAAELSRRLQPSELTLVDPGECFVDALHVLSPTSPRGRVDIRIHGRHTPALGAALSEFLSFCDLSHASVTIEDESNCLRPADMP